MSNPRFQGLRNNASSPGSIANAQNHDFTGSSKSLNGIPGSISSVIATSTTKTPIGDYAILWVVNTGSTVRYLFVGKDSDAPVTVDATNGMAIPGTQGFVVHCEASDDNMQSIVCKSSHADLHITIVKN